MTPGALSSAGTASLPVAADESAVAVARVKYGGLAPRFVAHRVHSVAPNVAVGALVRAIVFAAVFAHLVPAAEPVLSPAGAGVCDLPLIVAGRALAAVVCVVVFALPAVVAGHWPVCSLLPMTTC